MYTKRFYRPLTWQNWSCELIFYDRTSLKIYYLQKSLKYSILEKIWYLIYNLEVLWEGNQSNKGATLEKVLIISEINKYIHTEITLYKSVHIRPLVFLRGGLQPTLPPKSAMVIIMYVAMYIAMYIRSYIQYVCIHKHIIYLCILYKLMHVYVLMIVTEH